MDIINGFRQIFSRRPSQNDVERLARFMKSKQGIKLTAQLMQQTDSLTKKDVAAWRGAWQQAISYDRGCCKTTLKKKIKSLNFLKLRLFYVHKIL